MEEVVFQGLRIVVQIGAPRTRADNLEGGYFIVLK
jgi:hypothetical protein